MEGAGSQAHGEIIANFVNVVSSPSPQLCINLQPKIEDSIWNVEDGT